MTLHNHRTIPALEACKVCNPPDPGLPPEGSWFATVDADKLAAAVAKFQINEQDAIARTHSGKDVYFAMFMELVDRAVKKLAGVGYQDLADYQFYDAYQAGSSPVQVARDLLEEEGFPG